MATDKCAVATRHRHENRTVRFRTCKLAFQYGEQSSDDDSYRSLQEDTSIADYSDLDCRSSPSPLEHHTLPYFSSQLSPSDDSQSFDQYQSVSTMITDFIDYHYSFTGRFDHQTIGEYTPPPSYPSAFEQLGIATTMIAYFENHPHELNELNLDMEPNRVKVYKDSVPWSQYENACLVEEMSLHMRTRGESKIGGATLMAKMARILNHRYGIGRTPNGVKNQWYRTLRARSGIDERGCFRTARNAGRFAGPLAVSQGGSRGKSRSSKLHRSKGGAHNRS